MITKINGRLTIPPTNFLEFFILIIIPVYLSLSNKFLELQPFRWAINWVQFVVEVFESFELVVLFGTPFAQIILVFDILSPPILC